MTSSDSFPIFPEVSPLGETNKIRQKTTEHENKLCKIPDSYDYDISFDNSENMGNLYNHNFFNYKNDEIFNITDKDIYYTQKNTKILDNLNELIGKKRNNRQKYPNKNKKESIRNWNQLNKIKRNLIQDIILDWVNISIENPELRLKKIEPQILKNKYKNFSDIIDMTLSEIYSNDISKKEIIGDTRKEHNKIIIQNLGKDSIIYSKMNMTFKEVMKLFFNIFENPVKEGLIDYIQYFSSTKESHNDTYNKKIMNNLNKIYIIVANEKQSEKTTGTNSKHLKD